MGCCCSDATVNDDVPNPLPKYEDWKDDLKKDIGSDCGAVARDFPRMDVLVLTEPVGNEDPKSRQPEISDKEDRKPTKNSDEASLLERRNRVVLSLVNIGKLCDAPAIPRSAVNDDEAAEERAKEHSDPELAMISERLQAAADQHVSSSAADLSHALQKTLLETKLLFEPAPEPCEEAAVVEGEAPAKAPKTKKQRYAVSQPGTAAAVPMAVLLCFSQSIMFYPSQRVRHLLWFPWAQHLRDVGWNAMVFKRSAFPESIVVWHEQTVRNHVSEEEEKHTPCFQFSWRLELLLSAETGEVKEAAIIGTDCRLIKRKKGSSAFEKRVTNFERSVFDHFNLELKR